jgi:hypothetical protein
MKKSRLVLTASSKDNRPFHTFDRTVAAPTANSVPFILSPLPTSFLCSAGGRKWPVEIPEGGIAELEGGTGEPPKTPDGSSLAPLRGQKGNVAEPTRGKPAKAVRVRRELSRAVMAMVARRWLPSTSGCEDRVAVIGRAGDHLAAAPRGGDLLRCRAERPAHTCQRRREPPPDQVDKGA